MKKSDIFGFSPGMTFDETSKLVRSTPLSLPPGPRLLHLRLRYQRRQGYGRQRRELDARHPIWRVKAELNNPGAQDAAVKSISDQFNAEADQGRARDGHGSSAARAEAEL